MGLDFSQVFGQAKSAVDSAFNGATVQAGFNSALGYLEGQAVNIIQADQNDRTVQAQQNIKQVLDQPSTPGGFGSYLSELVQGPAMQKYGPYVIAGVAAIVVITLFVRGK